MGYSFQKYEEYKKANDLAFDEIPAAWKLQKVKHLFKVGRGRVISQEELDDNGSFPVYSSQTQNNGCLGYIHTYDFDCKQITWTTDGANAGTVFLREGQHNCTNVCGTLQSIKSNLNYHFYLYLLQYVTQFHKRPDTNGAKIMNGEMAAISLCIPSDIEQQKIANFLDHETAKIDTLITKQEKLIELLKEKRQAVISHAVTKGLNPDAPMKDSGVEWLGEVPEHWDVGSLSHYLSAIGDVDHYMPTSIEKGVPYVMTGDLTELASGIVFENCKQVDHSDYLKLSKRIKTSQGDVIMARYATIGTASYVDIDKDFLVSYSCVTIKPRTSKAIGLYLFYYFKSQAFLQGLQSHINTNTQGNVGVSDLRTVKITLPNIDDQKLIIEYLQSVIGKLDGLSKKSLAAIELAKERKTALISAAVTGKIDVRHFVAEQG
jgi:type I restriction enzyme S subunit